MFEHLTGPVAANPQRLGKQLDTPLDDLWSTRRGEYRAIYAIDDDQQVVSVVATAATPTALPERGPTTPTHNQHCARRHPGGSSVPLIK